MLRKMASREMLENSVTAEPTARGIEKAIRISPHNFNVPVDFIFNYSIIKELI